MASKKVTSFTDMLKRLNIPNWAYEKTSEYENFNYNNIDLYVYNRAIDDINSTSVIYDLSVFYKKRLIWGCGNYKNFKEVYSEIEQKVLPMIQRLREYDASLV